MKGKVTIQDVAKVARVSPAMVSRVVNNSPSVSPAAAQLVRGVIDDLGYKPGGRGRSARRTGRPVVKRTNRIAFLKYGEYDEWFEYSIYMKVIKGVEKKIGECGQTLVLRHFDNLRSGAEELFQSKVDGLVLLSNKIDDPALYRALKKYPCCQVMGVIDDLAPWDHVTYKNSMIGSLAADYLLERNRLTCGMITETGMPNDLWAERCDVFKRRIEAAGGKVLEFALNRISVEEWSCPIDKIMEKIEELDGFFVFTDEITEAFYRGLQGRGVVIGEKLDVVSCDNHPFFLRGLEPRPASVDLQLEAIGRKAAQQVLWRIENPTEPRVGIELDVKLRMGSEA